MINRNTIPRVARDELRTLTEKTKDVLATCYLSRPEVEVRKGTKLLLDMFARHRSVMMYRAMPRGFRVKYVAQEPYPNADTLFWKVGETNTLKVSNLNNTSTVFCENTNLLVRAAHDIFDHYLLHNGFSVQDELVALHNVLSDFDKYTDKREIPRRVLIDARNALVCEFALQPIVAEWLGGYDGTRDGYVFSQRVVDATGLFGILGVE